MPTAIQLINFCSRGATILQHGQDLDSNDENDILALLNNQLGGLVNKGADLGIATPLSASDEMYIDSDDEEALKAMLTKRIANHYGRPIRPDIETAAADSEAQLLAKYMILDEAEFDASLVNRQSRVGGFI